jgi:hypothetical protein
LFAVWKDPISGIESFILKSAPAVQQRSFYFINEGCSGDGRYLWFYQAFPPAEALSLGVADFRDNEVRSFPETQFLDASPVVDPVSGEAYWCRGQDVWKRGPQPGDRPVFINRLPDSMVRGRRPHRTATHLTFSADGKSLNFDAEIGTDCFVGDIPLDGTPVRLWEKFGRCYNHGQFSPVDPDLQLIAQDSMVHPITGEISGVDNRMHLIRRGGSAFPVLPKTGCDMHGHEWWSADGQRIWFIHYHQGVKCVELRGNDSVASEDPPETLAWALPTVSFAHANRDGQLLVANCVPSARENNVLFMDRGTGKVTTIATFLPPLPDDRYRYHHHAMPRFCLGDEFICYATTVLGKLDVALVPVNQLTGHE